MRKVRFRGKPTETFTFDFVDTVYSEKDFVYGALIYAGDQPYIVGETIDVTEDGVSFEFWVPVKPETVGMHTGLKDMNGNKIYGGDKGYTYDGFWVVEWSEPDAGFVLVSDDIQTDFSIQDSKQFEVVGDIHENEVEE